MRTIAGKRARNRLSALILIKNQAIAAESGLHLPANVLQPISTWLASPGSLPLGNHGFILARPDLTARCTLFPLLKMASRRITSGNPLLHAMFPSRPEIGCVSHGFCTWLAADAGAAGSRRVGSPGYSGIFQEGMGLCCIARGFEIAGMNQARWAQGVPTRVYLCRMRSCLLLVSLPIPPTPMPWWAQRSMKSPPNPPLKKGGRGDFHLKSRGTRQQDFFGARWFGD
jgi:hypothetical protein